MKTKLRNYHAVCWDEPIIYELNRNRERAILVPEVDKKITETVGDGISSIPKSMRRKNAPQLPALSQPQVLRHFLHLSQETLGIDFNIDIGQGTCTMKYNPKIHEQFVNSEKVAEMHPYQDESTSQGLLEIMYKTEQLFKEISGLDRFSLHPGGGSHGIYAISSLIYAYFKSRGEEDKRDEIITTIFSHPSDAAAPKVQGYKIIIIYPDDNGCPDIEALKKVVSERTAALLITNPEDTGIYNSKIAEFAKIVHDSGGLCGYDQANANGLLGITRAKEANFDLTFFNLHKTFSSPHGCGGPASGIVGVTNKLAKFLPVPVVDYDKKNNKYFLDYDRPDSIGKVKDFYGVIPVILRAYAWIMSLGAEGLREVSNVAILNNNYIMKKLLELRGVSMAFPEHKHRIEQVRYSWEKLTKETGIDTEDIQRRIFDFGTHYWTSHEPWLIPQPFTIEPSESYSKDDIDEFVAILAQIVKEAYEEPKKLKDAPHKSSVHHIDHDVLDDPAKWAITWRAYKKKYNGYFQRK